MKNLLINVEALEEARQPFEADLPREFLDEVLLAPPATEFRAGGVARVAGETTKMGKKVLLRAKFDMPLEGLCKRCLKPVKLQEPVELTRNYVPREDLPGAPPKGKRPVDNRDEEGTAATFDPGATDEEGYAGKQIDLRDALREQILLSIPPSPVCREECKGLCPSCGKDLNEGDCNCDRTSRDPRWAALKNIQLDKKEQ